MSKVNETVAKNIETCSKNLAVICEQVNVIAKAMEEILAEFKKDSLNEVSKSNEEQMPNQENALSLTEVRKILAEKSRAGFTAEIKQILLKHSADKLSKIAPTEYAALVADVEVLGNE